MPLGPDTADELILVDGNDQPLGHLDKASCHDGAGRLHRAFSILLRDSTGRHLLQRRSSLKRLWPRFWSNGCCSHPRRGESLQAAAHRRLLEELGLKGRLQFVYKFEYHARFGDAGSEHELCSVFVGEIEDPAKLRIDTDEVEEIAWLTTEQIDHDLEQHQQHYSPWFQLEWQRLTHEPELLEDSTIPGWGPDWRGRRSR